MSNISVSVKQNAGINSESEPVTLACRVERARRQLLKKMLENNRVAAYVAKRLIIEQTTGGDYSEILLLKNSEEHKRIMYKFFAEFAEPCGDFEQDHPDADETVNQKVVQLAHFVQPNKPVNLENLEVSSTAREMMHLVHFLPVFLIGSSELIQNQLALSGDLNPLYKAELDYRRQELKKLRQEMIVGNTGLVAFVAHKYKAISLSFEDLMQEGMVGLIKAVDRFDPERGNCFSTYAIFWIKQAVSRLIVKQDKSVPLPVALAEKSSPVFEILRKTYLTYERWPTLMELKACCSLSEQEIKTISNYYQATFVNDTSNDHEDDGMSVMEKMQQQQFTQPMDKLIETDLVRYMDRVLATLPEKQANILSMRFGLKNHTEMTLQAVADQLHVTRERVRQIQNDALHKLKQQFGFDLMPFLEPKDT
ncbi:sigma-70 family RNA polymerase sigma factor [Methylomonas sp. MgM2]